MGITNLIYRLLHCRRLKREAEILADASILAQLRLEQWLFDFYQSFS